MAFNVIGAQSDNGTTLVVYYNEPPGVGADDATNYAITGGFSVSGVGVVAGNAVTFSASGGVADGTAYTVTVSGVVSAGSAEPLTNGGAIFSLPVAVELAPAVVVNDVAAGSADVDVLLAVPTVEVTTGSVDVFALPAGGGPTPPPTPVTTYRMRAFAVPVSSVIQWDSIGAPDPTGAFSPYPGQVVDAVVLRVTTTCV